VSRTVEAGRGTEEKTPRPGFGVLDSFISFFLVVGRSGNHGLREVTDLPFSGVYLMYK
jgi:hypothetical protein